MKKGLSLCIAISLAFTCSCSFGTGGQTDVSQNSEKTVLTVDSLDDSESSLKLSKIDSKYQADMVNIAKYHFCHILFLPLFLYKCRIYATR